MLRKSTFIFTFISLFVLTASAQMENPVQWAFSATKVADKTYELHITATLEGNWHIYAQDAGEGPVPTEFNFAVNPLVKLDGKVKELGKLEKSYDPNFKSVLKFYGKKVDFVQKVKLKSNTSTVVNGTVTYMVCNDKRCLAPKDVPFSVKLGGK